jgi:hypothetical protein
MGHVKIASDASTLSIASETLRMVAAMLRAKNVAGSNAKRERHLSEQKKYSEPRSVNLWLAVFISTRMPQTGSMATVAEVELFEESPS